MIQPVESAKVEQQSTALPPETHVECGITLGWIDQMRLKRRFHGLILGVAAGTGKRLSPPDDGVATWNP